MEEMESVINVPQEDMEVLDSDDEPICPSSQGEDYHTETEPETDDPTTKEEEEEILDKRYNSAFY